MTPYVIVDVDTNTDRTWLAQVAEACTIWARDTEKPPPVGWGVGAIVRLAKDASDVLPGETQVLLLSHPDAPGALAYHDRDAAGRPYIKVFPLLQPLSQLAISICHEIIENNCNPELDSVMVGDDGVIRAREPADPVENTSYEVTLSDGKTKVAVTNWVTPLWGEPAGASSGPIFDKMGLCTGPYQVLDGGYVIQYDPTTRQFNSVEQGEASPRRAALRAVGVDKCERVNAAHAQRETSPLESLESVVDGAMKP